MDRSNLSRRRVVGLLVGSSAAALLAACGQAPPTAAPAKPTEAPKPAAAEPTKPAAASAPTTAPAPAAAAATTAPAAAATAAPAAAAPAKGAPITLAYWNELDMTKAAEDKLVADYKQQRPEVTLQVAKVPYDQYSTKLLTAMAGQVVPDVVFTHQDWVGTFAAKNALLALDDLAKDPAFKADSYYPAALEHQRWASKLYGLPWIMEVSSYFYNKEIIDKAGLEEPAELDKKGQWTLAKLTEYAEKLSTGDGANRVYGHSPYGRGKFSGMVDAIWGHDAEPFTADFKKLTLNSENALKAYDWALSLTLKNWAPTPAVVTTMGGYPPQELMNGGKFVMGKFNRGHTFAFKPEGKWGHVRNPTWPNGKHITRAGCSGHGIPPKTTNRTEAWELVKYLSVHGNEVAVAVQNNNPIFVAKMEGPDYAKVMRPWERIETYQANQKEVRVLVPPPGGVEVFGAVGRWVDQVLEKKVSLKEAMDKAVDESNKLITEAWG